MTATVGGESKRDVEARSSHGTFPRSARLLTVFYWQRQQVGAVVRAPTAKGDVVAGLRVGFTVGRALGGAVKRNRMKRRLREAVRLTRPADGPGADVVINPKKALLTVDFVEVVSEIRRAFEVIQQKLENKLEGKAGDKASGGFERGSRRREPKA